MEDAADRPLNLKADLLLEGRRKFLFSVKKGNTVVMAA